MSARDSRIRLLKADEKKQPPREKVMAEGAECSTIPTVKDALALLADAQRQLNTVQERIDRAREMLRQAS